MLSLIPVLKISFIINLLGFRNTIAYSSDYTYEKRCTDKNTIHIVLLDPTLYEANIVKANDGYGRENVSAIAKRSKAEVAINASFFDIGGDKDGKPSGTLIIKGHKYALKNQTQPLIIIKSGTLSIVQENPNDHLSKDVSIVSGIPLLIEDSKITQDLKIKASEFYTEFHARTALGIKPDGTIVIVVAEHNYSRDLKSITMGEVQSLIKEKGQIFVQKYNHQSPTEITLNELKEILKEEFLSPQGSQGLTILKLAEVMKDLGCKYALNLDGGGSSTLYVNDKVVNQTIGDNDEGKGLHLARAVSDAIVFKKR